MIRNNNNNNNNNEFVNSKNKLLISLINEMFLHQEMAAWAAFPLE